MSSQQRMLMVHLSAKRLVRNCWTSLLSLGPEIRSQLMKTPSPPPPSPPSPTSHVEHQYPCLWLPGVVAGDPPDPPRSPSQRGHQAHTSQRLHFRSGMSAVCAVLVKIIFPIYIISPQTEITQNIGYFITESMKVCLVRVPMPGIGR